MQKVVGEDNLLSSNFISFWPKAASFSFPKVVGEDNLLSSNFISFWPKDFEFAKAYAHFLLSMQKSKHKSK